MGLGDVSDLRLATLPYAAHKISKHYFQKEIIVGSQNALLVSRRPARKLEDHEGGLILKISKNSSKIVSFEFVSSS